MGDLYALAVDELDIYDQAARKGEVLAHELDINSHNISQVIRQIQITFSPGTFIEMFPSHLAENNAWQYLMKVFTMSNLSHHSS